MSILKSIARLTLEIAAAGKQTKTFFDRRTAKKSNERRTHEKCANERWRRLTAQKKCLNINTLNVTLIPTRLQRKCDKCPRENIGQIMFHYALVLAFSWTNEHRRSNNIYPRKWSSHDERKCKRIHFNVDRLHGMRWTSKIALRQKRSKTIENNRMKEFLFSASAKQTSQTIATKGKRLFSRTIARFNEKHLSVRCATKKCLN